MIENFLLGFNTISSFSAILYCFLGVFLGMLTGVLPGLGPIAVISMLLPFVFSVNDSTLSLIMLAGVYYGTQYGGSISAILFKIPGESSSVITTIDGHYLSLKGRAGPALTVSALSSLFAGVFSCILIFFIAEPISLLSLKLGPLDFTWLMFLGLMISILMSKHKIISSACMLCLGILLGMIGIDSNSGIIRFTFGNINLVDGINFAIISMGMIGLAEIFYNLTFQRASKLEKLDNLNLYPTKQEFKDSISPTIRGSIIGSILGAIPGAGPIISPYVSYWFEKQFSKNKDKIGTGSIEGLAGPESSNNAAAQTGFIPLFTLGVPFTPIMALIMVSLISNDRYPGPSFISSYPDLFYGFVLSMLLGNIILVILNIPLIKFWISILLIPRNILYPVILIICFIGTYTFNNNIYDILILIPFIIVGIIFKYLKCDVITLTMGFICGPLFEEYFRRSMMILDGNLMLLFLHPIFYLLVFFVTIYLIFVRRVIKLF